MRRPALLLAFLLVLAAPLAADLEVPFLSGRINDTAGLLTPGARERVEGKLAALEQRTGNQVAVLTIPSLEGEPLEDYSVRVAETWKLGQKGKDNGALLLISKGDRKLRLEVGYGLEPVLTDLKSRVILDEVIRPRFRDGDFEGGIEAGVDAIATTVEGKPLPVAAKPPEDSARELPVVPRLVMLLVFLFVVGSFSLAAIGSRGFGSWFLYLFLTPFYFIFPAGLLGVGTGLGFGLGWLIAFPLLKRFLGPRLAQRTGSRRGSVLSPWILGGGGGGWSSRGGGWRSGGGGFGGFSGGGGSFGGGGASGSW